MADTNKRNKSRQKTDEEILAEIKSLSEKGQQFTTPSLDFPQLGDLGDEDIDTGFDPSILSDTADPDRSHRLYYAMRRIMIDNLPKGKQNLRLRRYIYDEKSLYLNRGKDKDANGIKHSDERQAYISGFLQVAFDTTINWLKAGANPFDLYNAFRMLNEDKGFRKKEGEGDETGEGATHE